MKTFKNILHYTNCLFVAFCLITALIYGEKALAYYFLLAVFQVFISIIITFTSITKETFFKTIFIYWLSVAIYFIIILPIATTLKIQPFGLLFFPIVIAIHNCYLTYLIKTM
jgi:hypothetical protein